MSMPDISEMCQGANSIAVPPEVARICCDSRSPHCLHKRVITVGATSISLCVLPTERSCRPSTPVNGVRRGPQTVTRCLEAGK